MDYVGPTKLYDAPRGGDGQTGWRCSVKRSPTATATPTPTATALLAAPLPPLACYWGAVVRLFWVFFCFFRSWHFFDLCFFLLFFSFFLSHFSRVVLPSPLLLWCFRTYVSGVTPIQGCIGTPKLL